jgi:hypothetical protein
MKVFILLYSLKTHNIAFKLTRFRYVPAPGLDLR